MLPRDEHSHQAALVQWCALNSRRFPELMMLFAIPNGGLRDKVVGYRLRQEGVRSGVPDLFLACARRNKHGLFIEMKDPFGQPPTRDQAEWHKALLAHGYEVKVCYGIDQAIDAVEWYLDMPRSGR